MVIACRLPAHLAPGELSYQYCCSGNNLERNLEIEPHCEEVQTSQGSRCHLVVDTQVRTADHWPAKLAMADNARYRPGITVAPPWHPATTS